MQRGIKVIGLSLLIAGAVSLSEPETSLAATDLIVESNMTLPAGEYTYNSVMVKSGVTLTLEGDQNATGFKGVRLLAENITVETGAYISADGQGYGSQQGPGASANNRTGGSYGGRGLGASVGPTYGSAVNPSELGSGGGHRAGGGAIILEVTDTLAVDGEISANGDNTGSGGSINITTGVLTGSGVLSAQGGQYAVTSRYLHPGGGGRVFVSYRENNFSGSVTTKGGRNN